MKYCISRKSLFIFLCIFAVHPTLAQSILNKKITIDISRQRLDNVLEILSNKGNFYFSYNSAAIKKDSIVTMAASNKTVKEILTILLPDVYEYKESGNYLIIRRAPVQLKLVTKKAATEDKQYAVSGYVLDDETGYKITNASIYEKTSLAAALTNDNGYFRIRLKSKARTAALTISKEYYRDTTVIIEPRYNQQISVAIVPLIADDQITIVSPEDYFVPDSLKVLVKNDSTAITFAYVKVDSSKVESTGFGRFFLTSRQKIQSLNLTKFFTEKPFQVSIIPVLSTHGKMSSQVVNNFSFNIFGGYSGGVKGMEIGGLFNINKKNAQYIQMAGLFNMVGQNVCGVQIAGINNTVLDSVKGVQSSGISNIVKGNLSGLQLAGVYNHVADRVNGLQAAGVANFARKKMIGAQFAGVVNFSNEEMLGIQAAGLVNYARKMKGVQIGLVNIADSSDGYSIGLINIIIKGYHKLSLSANEVLNTNAAFKTGSSKFYSILLAGMNIGKSDQKIYSFGYGLGSDLRIGKNFSVNPEITSQYLYLGSWDYLNLLNKFHFNFNLKLGKYFSLFAGPSVAAYYTKQPVNINGYKPPAITSGYYNFNFGNSINGWIGWNAGINFF